MLYNIKNYLSSERGSVLIIVMSSLDKLWREREASRAERMPAAPAITKHKTELLVVIIIIIRPRYWDQPGWLVSRLREEPSREADLGCLWAQWRERLSRKKNTEMRRRTQSTSRQVAWR